jgi:type IV secretory pathway VirB10-like protein
MAIRQPTPTKGAQKPKTASQPHAVREQRSQIADLDVDERRAFEEWKREQEQKQSAWEHKTQEELELKFLEKLNKKNEEKEKGTRRKKKNKSESWGNEDACGNRKPQIDLELLADKVFQRLIFEARIERERAGGAG